jgi:membrane protease subunit HflC
MRILIPLAVLVVAALIGVTQIFYTVDQTQQAIITQFGQYQRTVDNPGLHVKTPFVQTAHILEKRLLRFDAIASEFLTQEKKALVIDSYARYQIIDPRTFFEKVTTEAAARARLEAIVTSELREEVATHDQIEVIKDNREFLMAEVTQRSDLKAREFGMQVVDVRIVRADFPSEVAPSVYSRMVSERTRVANQFRAEGAEEADRIRGDAEREQRTILAEADQEALGIRGEGEAQAIDILGTAINKDIEFFRFVRTLDAYAASLSDGGTFVLPSDSEFYQFLTSSILISDREE